MGDGVLKEEGTEGSILEFLVISHMCFGAIVLSIIPIFMTVILILMM